MSDYVFDAVIKPVEGLDAAYIEFPYDVETEFGLRGQIKVQVTFDDVPYRGSLVRMNTPCHIIGMTKDIRKAIGKGPGDTVHIRLSRDESPRTVELPEDFAARLDAEPEAQAFFSSLSYTHQKEYVRWVTEARKAETREKRLSAAVTLLLEKKKQHN